MLFQRAHGKEDNRPLAVEGVDALEAELCQVKYSVLEREIGSVIVSLRHGLIGPKHRLPAGNSKVAAAMNFEFPLASFGFQ
jgi:hypothetical protein